MANLTPVIWFFKTFSKWILFFLFMIWIFVLGILVGRETAPVKIEKKDLQKELAELKKADMAREADHLKTETKKLQENQPLEFYEELKDTSQKPKEPLVPEQTEKTEPPVPKNPSVLKATPESKKPTEARNDASLSESTEKVSTPKLNLENAKMTIQIAAFRDRKSADIQASELRRKGFDAYVSESTETGKAAWYRVRVGYFNRQEEARETIERLRREKISSYMTKIR